MRDHTETRLSHDRSLWAAALLALTAIRLAVAAALPLSPDEAYYWTWSKALAPGYLDHPPMVALWIRAGTAMLGDTALGVRVLAPLSAAAGTLLLVRAGDALRPGAGVPAALLLNATLMLGAGSVTMTPDTPLLFFWTAAAWALARLIAGGTGRWWLMVGATAGLAALSKYTAALLGLGIGLLLLGPLRRWLGTLWPWAGGVVAAALVAPVIGWNAAHGWASFARQGGRLNDGALEAGRAARYLGELLAGQLGLATPLVALIMVLGTAAACRRWRDPARALPLALVLPGAALFLQHAFTDRVQANWVAILYPGAALAAGLHGHRLIRPAVALGLVLTGLVYLQATLAPLPLPRPLDPTLRLAGWDTLAADSARAADAAGATQLASEEYGTACLLAWHAPRPAPELRVIGAEPRWRLFTLPAAAPAPTLLLISARRREGPDPAQWASAEPLGTLTRQARGLDLEQFRLYLAVPRPGAPTAQLPSRMQ